MQKQNISSRERFKRLATIRTNEILNRLRILGHCSNKQAYEYTQEDIDKIFGAIEKQVRIIKSKFNHNIEQSNLKIKL